MRRPEEVLSQYLEDKDIRKSEQRYGILDVFLKTERHLTVAEIYELARKRYTNIGFATVYRAMKVICEAGVAEEIDFGDGVKRFEHKYGHEHHDHLICLKCGRFIETKSSKIEKLQEKIAKENGFAIVRHKMQLFGFCRECGKKRRKEG